MGTRVYKNLIPDSNLHHELESLLRRSGGVATLEEICSQVFRLPAAAPSLARALVEELIEGDLRVRLAADKTVEWSEPSPEEIWRRRKHFLVVDVETTDGVRRTQRIIELGICRIEDGRITDEWSQLVNPDHAVSPWIRNLTGITNGMLAAAPRFAEVADRLLDELEGAILVAHHARFDVAVLSAELSRLRGQRLGNHYLCTVELARHGLPGMENYRLETLSHTLGLRHERPHRAGSDARATAELFTRLAETSDWALAAYLRPRPPSHQRGAQIIETQDEQIS
ncbi:MAG: PolC-type DNA polymerase III [Terriglobia bacterium]